MSERVIAELPGAIGSPERIGSAVYTLLHSCGVPECEASSVHIQFGVLYISRLRKDEKGNSVTTSLSLPWSTR